MNKKLVGFIVVALLIGFMAGISIKLVEANWPTFVTGQKNVSSKGTPVQLPNLAIEQDMRLIIKAKTANTGIVYLGNSSGAALFSGSSHFKLYPGESVELKITNADRVWFDAENGEGIEYITETD